MNYEKLKSGTDIRGIATDKGGKAVTLTDSAVYDITAAFAVWLKEKVNKDDIMVSVGRDSRITGPVIMERVQTALINSGFTVMNCGLSSTPAMFMTTLDANCDAAVQITASHHPFDRNGLKFFTKNGGLNSGDILEIIALANEQKHLDCAKGTVIKTDFMQNYAAHLRKMICDAVGKSENDLPLKNYKIIVDAGNGAGGFYAYDVLEKLGADISGSQFLNPDGMFPNHIPNPENKDAMQSIKTAVLENKADLGLIFDTDVDRAGCVDKDGETINRNRLIALASYIAVKGEKGKTIVTDSVTSDGLHNYIEDYLGCKHYRFKRGYKNVINKAEEFCKNDIDTPLAIETSGHAAFKENYFLDDGAYLVTKIVIELAKGNDIEKILKPLTIPAEEKEVRFNILCDDFGAYGDDIIKKLEIFANENSEYNLAPDNREGLRINTKNGWFLLRLSVHDPVVVVNFESRVNGGIAEDIEKLRPFLTQFNKLDISNL